MSAHITSALIAAVAGLLAGTLIVWVAPRLAADRLEETPEYPPLLVLLPVAGVHITRWRLARALGTEVGTAVLMAALAAHLGWDRELLIACLYSALLILIAYIDLDYRLVLNKLSLPGTALALLLSVAWPGIGLLSAVEGAAVGLVLFLVLLIVSRGALGMGDIKMAMMIGAMRGFPAVFNALVFGVLLGGVAALVLLVVFRRGRRDMFAYAPYLALGAALSLLTVAQ